MGRVSPNPLVGCVIVYNNKIIGEGWHRNYGGPHAEVNAINSVRDKGLLSDSTLYVNLEPCSHHGKTPPCAGLIVSSGIKKVIIANRDPNPLVAGKGITRLREAGIEVREGILEDAGAYLNRRFLTFHRHQRPYIILKWAQTRDGFIARTNYDSKWISNEYSRQLAHQYRAREDAVMVGSKTAEYDNPELTVRHWEGKNPLRIVLDSDADLNTNLKLFDGTAPTLCYNYVKNENGANVEFIKVPEDGFWGSIWADLCRRGIQSVLVEGGGKILSGLLSLGSWDEARVFASNKKFGDGIKAPVMATSFTGERIISGDILRIYYNRDVHH